METPSVKDALSEWLRANGYDGLFNEGNCACSVDDLMPCYSPSSTCKAGYMVSCCECDEQDRCYMGQEYDYLISWQEGVCTIKGDEES